jgi:hypothetical protein
MPEPASHLDLLATARSLRRAAATDEPNRLRQELGRLRTDLIDQLRDEEEDIARLPGATQAVVRHGQQRLLRMIDDLVATTGEADPDCACVVRCAGIEAALHRQARLEAGLLARHGISPT